MKSKLIVFGLAVIILALLAILFFVPGRSPSETTPPPPTPPPPTGGPVPAPQTPPASGSSTSVGIPDLFEVTTPAPNAVIKSPVTLKGRARGAWYFEASYPIKIVDANGKVLANVPVMATADWMTPDFVPFEAQVTFTAPGIATGKIIFMKDNPSGLPEHERSYELPVRFQ